MIAQSSSPSRARGCASRPWGPRLAALFLAAFAPAALALTISNVKVVNVTPSGFSVLWETSEPAVPSLTVYSDAAGGASLTGQVGVEVFPLNTGKLGPGNAYEKRLSQSALRDATKGLNLSLVRVTGCLPGGTYFFRARATAAASSASFPVAGTLPSVVLPRANSFVAQARQLVIDLPAGTMEGRLVTLSTADAAHPLAAVAGDGVGPNQVWFNLAELFARDGAGNLTVPGDRLFTIEILGQGVRDKLAAYTLRFGQNFVVADADVRGFAREDRLVVKIGSTAILRGQDGNVPISLATGARFTEIRFRLTVPSDDLVNLVLQSAGSQSVTPTLVQTGPGQFNVTLAAAAGAPFSAAPEIARLNFSSTAGAHSAAAGLGLSDLVVQTASSIPVTNRLSFGGRVFLIAQEPILEAKISELGDREVTLYGLPGVAYLAETAPSVSGPINWSAPIRISLEGISAPVPGVPAQPDVFLRARREP